MSLISCFPSSRRDAFERDPIWALAIENSFEDLVRFCLAGDSLRFNVFLGKDPFVEVVLDLVDPLCFLVHRCEQQTLPYGRPAGWGSVYRGWRERFVCACGQGL